MPFESKYFNITTLRWVASYRTPNQIPDPIWGEADTRDFGVTFLEQLDKWTVGVVQSVVAVTVYLSNPDTPNTTMTSVAAGAASNNQHPFVLPLAGVAAITTFMTGEDEPKKALCEFRITTAAGVNSYPGSVFIAPKQGTSAVPDETPEDRALRLSEGRGLFVLRNQPNGAITIRRSPDGTKAVLEYLGDDGQMHWDVVDPASLPTP